MSEPAPAPAQVEGPLVEPKRHPAALATAISQAWRPYRWRAYVVGFVAGFLAGGVAAPIATTSLQLMLALVGVPDAGVPWWEVVWSIVFAVTMSVVSAATYSRWQPPALREAAQAYLWLALRAEDNWTRTVGAQPVPREPHAMRAALASMPATPETAGERFGLWIALLDLNQARAAAAEIPETTAADRFQRAAALWLADFVGGASHAIDPLQRFADLIDEPGKQLEAHATLAVSQARLAIAEDRDWRPPLAAIRPRLGSSPEDAYHRYLRRPTFRGVFISTLSAVAVFWLAWWLLEPYARVGVPQ